jgi:hypothetical protein
MMNAQKVNAMAIVILRLPTRLIPQPVMGCATSAPMAMLSSARLNAPSLSPSCCLMSGMRANQLAIKAPLAKKTIDTAARARRGGVIALVTPRSTVAMCCCSFTK